jgi:hypothetical protein
MKGCNRSSIPKSPIVVQTTAGMEEDTEKEDTEKRKEVGLQLKVCRPKNAF